MDEQKPILDLDEKHRDRMDNWVILLYFCLFGLVMAIVANFFTESQAVVILAWLFIGGIGICLWKIRVANRATTPSTHSWTTGK